MASTHGRGNSAVADGFANGGTTPRKVTKLADGVYEIEHQDALDGFRAAIRPSSSAIDRCSWWMRASCRVQAEPPGFVVIYRYREAPHPRVTFQTDFSTRLQPQPGMKVIYARTSIASDREQVKKLEIGYSDDVSVFLNGKILYRGRSAQGFRDPRFLGIMNPENDAVYLPLRKGNNELMLAVSELGGGWGFICRLVDPEQ